MERIKSLNRYQKGVLLVLVVMVLVFTVLYPVTMSRQGYLYKDTILVPSQEKDAVVYSGNIEGQKARFTVSADKTVEFQYGQEMYGPYTAREDPTAAPQEGEWPDSMTGVELRCGEEIVFRGGVVDLGGERWLYNEDGSLENIGILVTSGSGIVTDENGDAVDPMEPSATTILDLMEGPELTHKGEWQGWLLGVAFCAVTAILILFADELFRWSLQFSIRNADQAEPSGWEMIGRYISWTAFPIFALVAFVVGLS